MSSQKLTRTTYRDPTDPSNPLRSGDVARAEAAMDMDQYYRPLEQVHASGLHQFGAADGLRVNATNGAQGIKVLPGIALDGLGRHISLAAGGQAEVGLQADAPGAAPQLVLVDAVNGASVPTTGVTGDRLVVIRHWETFDENAWNMFNAYIFTHTPWIRVVPAVGYVNNGNEVILARVTLDGAGNVTGLTPGPRHGVGVPTETVRLRRAHQAAPSPSFGVADAAYGEIRPRPAGGMQITTTGATDTIEVQRDNGGSVANITLAAEQTDFRRNDGLETVRVISSLGHIEAGTKGVDGDVRLFDHAQRLTIALDGHDAVGVFGAEGIDGEVRVIRRTGHNAFQARGDGDVWFRGALRDYDGTHPGVSHAMLKDLTDGLETNLHRHRIVPNQAGTRIGMKSGWITLADTGGDVEGHVRIDFSNNLATQTSGSGFLSHAMSGSFGVFSGQPHALCAPTQLTLSTHSDTAFKFYPASVSPTEIEFTYWIDTAGRWGIHYFDFIIIGPMA